MNSDERLVAVRPSERQFLFQQTEFYAFVHFTVNTFTDQEWGDGTEDEAVFNPVKFDAKQWVDAVKSAGMKGLILTCKHHDGFCLWPSKLTKHSVASSPWKNGRGDIVREVSDECHKQGIRFGVYLSPWDRNSALYGQGKAYDDYFVGQLTELLTNYGEVFSVWFDGACGEGPNGKKQVYDWDRYHETIRTLQPGACINVCGPDIRWCGNEAGRTRASEWSVVPARMRDTEKIQNASQKEDNAEFRLRPIRAQDQDLGSRARLKDEADLVWYPAEVNTSIRPGWFWHEKENDNVKSLEEIIYVYDRSVGGNGTFLLNIPPTREGLFHENDVKRLRETGEYLERTYRTNLLTKGAEITADSGDTAGLLEDCYDSFWMAEKGKKTAEFVIRWPEKVSIGKMILKENILLSQRVEAFTVEAMKDGRFEEIFNGTVIGYKRIVSVFTETEALRIRIKDSRTEPTLAFMGIYEKQTNNEEDHWKNNINL